MQTTDVARERDQMCKHDVSIRLVLAADEESGCFILLWQSIWDLERSRASGLREQA